MCICCSFESKLTKLLLENIAAEYQTDSCQGKAHETQLNKRNAKQPPTEINFNKSQAKAFSEIQALTKQSGNAHDTNLNKRHGDSTMTKPSQFDGEKHLQEQKSPYHEERASGYKMNKR